MYLFTFLACFSNKQQISALETQIQVQQQQIAAQQAHISTLEQQLKDRASDEERVQQREREAQALQREIYSLYDAGNIEEAKSKLEYALKEYGDTKTAYRMNKLQKELALFGKDVPENWGEFDYFQGEWTHNAEALTLIVFWEVWCPHCKNSLPEVQTLYAANKDRGFEVVGMTKLTRDVTKEQAMEFVESNNIQYPILKEDGTVSTYFNVSGIPAAALLMQGKVVWRGHPANVDTQMLNKYLQ